MALLKTVKKIWQRPKRSRSIFATRWDAAGLGKTGDLVYTRLAPPLEEMNLDYHVALTTPYILVGTPKKAWLQFFERNKIKKDQVGHETRLYKLFKQGKNRQYWPEYVFYAYVNFMPDRIFLTGIPDQPQTLPCLDKFDPSTMDHEMIRSQLRSA